MGSLHKKRPSSRYKPKLKIDGNQWCASYGGDMPEGVQGFGDSPELAYADFDIQWRESLSEKIKQHRKGKELEGKNGREEN